MESSANLGKYKLIEYRRREGDFVAFSAINVDSSQHGHVVINKYNASEDVRKMLPLYYNLDKAKACTGFMEFFIEGTTLGAVFETKKGTPFESIFGKKSKKKTKKLKIARKVRMELVESLLESALRFADAPDIIANATLNSMCTFVNLEDKKFYFEPIIPPNVESTFLGYSRELARMVIRIFNPTIKTQTLEYDFMDEISLYNQKSAAEMLSLFREARQEIDKLYPTKKKKDKDGGIGTLLKGIMACIKHKNKLRKVAKKNMV